MSFTLLYPKNKESNLSRNKYYKTSNSHYFYIKDKEDNKTIIRVPTHYLFYSFPDRFYVNSFYDIKNMDTITKKEFTKIIVRLKSIISENMICFDYPFIIRYLAICKAYKISLMNKVIMCKKDNDYIEVKV